MLLLVGITVVPEAQAATVAAINCTGTWLWGFTPDLGLSGQSGVVFVQTFGVPNACPYAAVSGLGADEQLIIFDGSFEAPYVGDCLHATVFMPDGEIHIIGGTVIVGFGGSNGNQWQLVGVFAVPPCMMNGISEVNLSVEYADIKDVTDGIVFLND